MYHTFNTSLHYHVKLHPFDSQWSTAPFFLYHRLLFPSQIKLHDHHGHHSQKQQQQQHNNIAVLTSSAMTIGCGQSSVGIKRVNKACELEKADVAQVQPVDRLSTERRQAEDLSTLRPTVLGHATQLHAAEHLQHQYKQLTLQFVLSSTSVLSTALQVITGKLVSSIFSFSTC